MSLGWVSGWARAELRLGWGVSLADLELHQLPDGLETGVARAGDGVLGLRAQLAVRFWTSQQRGKPEACGGAGWAGGRVSE